MTRWPGGAQGALCLSFDNLGEAAEIELGAVPADASLGQHFTATRVLPALLDSLGERDLAATFFVEGLNAELYPQALQAIAAGGHEVAYHAWCHERWGDLSVDEQEGNLARGLAAFRGLARGLGREFVGMRPPGGQLGEGGLGVLRRAGLRYCSPAGAGASADDGVALLPFQWRHVDATCVLPALGSVREQMTGSPDPLDPDAFLAYLEEEIDRLAKEGGFMSIVFHPFMLDWFSRGRLILTLECLRNARNTGNVWIAPFAAAAEHVLAHPDDFPAGGTTLDSSSWAG